jgi:hypothetical protein
MGINCSGLEESQSSALLERRNSAVRITLRFTPKWIRNVSVMAATERPVPRKRNGLLVKDKAGNRFTVVERECVETDLGFARKVIWFELETGERVKFVDGGFLLPNGEKLRWVRNPNKGRT